MTSQTGRQTITRNMLLNISKSKGNQTTSFGQLIEYTSKIMQKIRQEDCFVFQKSFI